MYKSENNVNSLWNGIAFSVCFSLGNLLYFSARSEYMVLGGRFLAGTLLVIYCGMGKTLQFL